MLLEMRKLKPDVRASLWDNFE